MNKKINSAQLGKLYERQVLHNEIHQNSRSNVRLRERSKKQKHFFCSVYGYRKMKERLKKNVIVNAQTCFIP